MIFFRSWPAQHSIAHLYEAASTLVPWFTVHRHEKWSYTSSTCVAYAIASFLLPSIITRFSSLLYEAWYPRLWLPVTTTQSSANGSITTILSCVIANPSFSSSFCQPTGTVLSNAFAEITRASCGAAGLLTPFCFFGGDVPFRS